MRTVIGLGLVLAACGNDGGGGSVSIDNLGMELATASCRKQFDCCTAAELTAQYMGITYEGQPITTEDQCVAFSNAVFSSLAVASYRTSIDMGRITYDGAAASACIDAIDALSCPAYAGGKVDDLAGCHPFLIPKVADGGGCTQDYECTSKNCEGETTPFGGQATDGACKPIPAIGAACEDNCATGAYCSSGTCAAFKTDGTACILSSECASDFCTGSPKACAPKPLTCDGI